MIKILDFLENNLDKEHLDILTKQINKVSGEYYFVPAIQGKFNFPYVLYIPNKIDSTTLIMHGNNLANEDPNDLYNVYSAVMETSIHAGYELTDLNQVIFIPVTSNYIHPANNNMREFFPMQATRNVVFCTDTNNIYYNIFGQINNMLLHLTNIIENLSSITLDNKIICHGFSSSAKFVLRYATFNAEKVSLVIAGGFGAQSIIPLKEYNGEKLIYPIGVYDVPSFNEKAFANMRQYYFMGEKEDNSNDTAQNFRHTDPEITKLYIKLFGNNIWDRFNKLKDIYRELGLNNITLEKFIGYGHSATPGEEITTKLIKEYRK